MIFWNNYNFCNGLRYRNFATVQFESLIRIKWSNHKISQTKVRVIYHPTYFPREREVDHRIRNILGDAYKTSNKYALNNNPRRINNRD